MSSILETIQINNGNIQQLAYHEARLNRTRQALFGLPPLALASFLDVPNQYQQGIVRCRVIYQQHIEDVSFVPYLFKPIQKLALVEDPSIDYRIKWLNRQAFAQHLAAHPQADEVLITQHGFITDATIANLAFWDGHTWATPHTPLLKGTKRQYLLDTQQLHEKPIHLKHLQQYQAVCLINTFRDLRLEDAIPIEQILL